MRPLSEENLKNYEHLKKAIRHGHIDVTERLLLEDVPVNFNSDLTRAGCQRTPLHFAVQHGCLNLIQKLLNKGASVCARDDFWETPLMLSVRLRKYSVTDLLLTADILDDFEYDSRPLRHLHIACMRNNFSAVKKLISSGAEVNESVDFKSFYWAGYTPLHFAVESHGIEIVKLLLDNGADLMGKNANSMTPLHLAHEVRDEVIIDLLLSAQLSVLGNPKDGMDLSHFHVACTRNDRKVVEFFLEQGFDVNSQVSDGWISRWSEWQPLMFAIYHECPDVVELLLMHGAYLTNQYNVDDESHLQLAYQVGNQKIIDILLKSREIKNRGILKSKALSPLESACTRKYVGKIEKLLHRLRKKFGSDLDVSLWNGCTPLHYLIRSNPKNVMEILSYFQGSISIKDSRGKTPLHVFFEYIYSDYEAFIPSDILDFKNNPSDSCGLTHLHITCASNRVDLIEKFIEYGADINCAVDSNSLKWAGYTPLHFAVKYEKLKILDVLLKNGAKVSAQNGDGLTPFDMAIMNLNSLGYRDKSKKWLMVWSMLLRDERSDDDFDRRGFSLFHIVCSTKIKLDSAQLHNYVNILPGGIDQAINFPASKYHQNSPLHFACNSGNYNIAKWLIDNGANIHLENCGGFTPFQVELDSAGRYGILKKNPKLLQVSGNPSDLRGVSYFHRGCYLQDFETMEFYVRSGVNVNVRTKTRKITNAYSFRNRDAETPLHLAVQRDSDHSADVVKYLIDNGADVMARDAYLNTPIFCMYYSFNKEVAQLLLDSGADVDAQNFLGETPLYLACSSSRLKEIRFFIENGADINIVNDRGDTPFTYVCELDMNVGGGDDRVLLTLFKHVKKRMVIGFYVSDVNRRMYSRYLKRYTLPNFQEYEIEEKCLKEIQLMKSLRVSQSSTVFDVVFKTSNDMAYLIHNASLRELVTASDFSSKFPMYGYLIKLQCKRGLRRKPLLQKCKKSLHSLANISAESSEKIMEYLKDCDLRNIIASVNVIL